MNGFERRRELKKKAILEAAGKIFFEKGYKDTTIEEIALHAKVSPTSVYNFFNTKNNLYVRTIEAAFHEAMDKYDEILNSKKSFYEKLIEFIRYRVASRSGKNPDYFKTEDIANPEIAAIIGNVTKTRIIPFFIRLVEQGKKEGAIDESIDAESVILYINIFMSGLTNSHFIKKISNDERLSINIGKLFLFGFVGSADKNFDRNLFSLTNKEHQN